MIPKNNIPQKLRTEARMTDVSYKILMSLIGRDRESHSRKQNRQI